MKNTNIIKFGEMELGKFKTICNAMAHGVTHYEAGVFNKAFEETQTAQAFIVNANAKGFTFRDDDMPERIYKAVIAAVSTYLGKVKVANPEQAVSLVLTDINGSFKFAGIVEYHENENNKDEPGNWSYVLTFNEEDLESVSKKRDLKKYLFGDDAFKNILDTVAYDVASIQFEHSRYMYDACLIAVDTLIGVLDKEAKENEVVDIEMPGYFVASVAVESGVKVFSITPEGAMKELIKGDIDLDK